MPGDIKPIVYEDGVPLCSTACPFHRFGDGDPRCVFWSDTGRPTHGFCEPAIRRIAAELKAAKATEASLTTSVNENLQALGRELRKNRKLRDELERLQQSVCEADYNSIEAALAYTGENETPVTRKEA